MIMDPNIGARGWFVVFQHRHPEAYPQWFHSILPKDFAHVWAYTWHPETGTYVVIDPRGNHLYTEPLASYDHPDKILRNITERDTTQSVVYYDKPEQIRFKQIPHIAYTCVSVIKDLLAIDRLWTVLPRQLHAHLLEIGGVELYRKK